MRDRRLLIGGRGRGRAEGVESVEGGFRRDLSVTSGTTAALSTVTQHDRH